MGVVGFQDFWVAGARLYIEKQLDSGLPPPLIDLGTIQQANPSVTPEIVQLLDSDGGSRSVVDEGLTSIDESYDVNASNMNMDNLSLLFMADGVQVIDRLQEAKLAFLTATAGEFLKVKVADFGPAEWGLRTLDGIYSFAGTPTVHLTESMTQGTDLIVLTVANGDVTAAYPPSGLFIVSGANIDDPLNAGTYTVLSSTFTGGKTEITIDPVATKAINSDEVFGSIGGLQLVNPGGSIYDPRTDWSVHSLERGIAAILAGGAIPSGQVGVSWSVTNLTGPRILFPQSTKGAIKATAYLVYSRDNFLNQSVRTMEVSITPSGATVQGTDYSSMTLTFRVISDLTQSQPAGSLFYFAGAVPESSSPSDDLP